MRFWYTRNEKIGRLDQPFQFIKIQDNTHYISVRLCNGKIEGIFFLPADRDDDHRNLVLARPLEDGKSGYPMEDGLCVVGDRAKARELAIKVMSYALMAMPSSERVKGATVHLTDDGRRAVSVGFAKRMLDEEVFGRE